MSLPTNYKDDLLDTSQNTSRVYDIVNSSNSVVQANVHLVEKTVYTQTGTELSAQDFNNTNSKVNDLETALGYLNEYFDKIVVVDSLPTTKDSRTLYLSKE